MALLVFVVLCAAQCRTSAPQAEKFHVDSAGEATVPFCASVYPPCKMGISSTRVGLLTLAPYRRVSCDYLVSRQREGRGSRHAGEASGEHWAGLAHAPGDQTCTTVYCKLIFDASDSWVT